MTRRETISVVVMICLAWCLVWLAGSHMLAERRAACAAKADLDDSRTYVAAIKRLSQLPSLAGSQSKAPNEIQVAVEKQAKAAGIPLDSLADISPQQPQRLGDSPLKEQPTAIRLENVSMKQVVSFVYSLASQGDGLIPKSIRLRPPRRDESSDLWIAEIVMVYLLHESPKAAER